MKSKREDWEKLLYAVNGINEKYVTESSIIKNKSHTNIKMLAVAACAALVILAGVLIVGKINSPHVTDNQAVLLESLYVADTQNDRLTAYTLAEQSIGGVTVPTGQKLVFSTKDTGGIAESGSIVNMSVSNPKVSVNGKEADVSCDALTIDAYIFENKEVTQTDYKLRYEETLVVGNYILNFDEAGGYALYGVSGGKLNEIEAKVTHGTFDFGEFTFEYLSYVLENGDIVNLPNVLKEQQLLTSAGIISKDGTSLLIEITYPHANDRSVNKNLVLYSEKDGSVTPVITGGSIRDQSGSDLIHDITVSESGEMCIVEVIEDGGNGKTRFYSYDLIKKESTFLGESVTSAWFWDGTEIITIEENGDTSLNIVAVSPSGEKRIIAESVGYYAPGGKGFILPIDQAGRYSSFCIVVDENGKMCFFDFASGKTALISGYFYPANSEAVAVSEDKAVLLCLLPFADSEKSVCIFDFTKQVFTVCGISVGDPDISMYNIVGDALVTVKNGTVIIMN